jgi:hypothetical protein
LNVRERPWAVRAHIPAFNRHVLLSWLWSGGLTRTIPTMGSCLSKERVHEL